jgi:hypothetical protein
VNVPAWVLADSWVSVTAAVAAACIALAVFLERLLHRPKLVLEGTDEPTAIPVWYKDREDEGTFARLVVRNRSRFLPAEEVCLVISHARIEYSDGDVRTLGSIVDLTLAWANIDLTNRDAPERRILIPPRSARRVDLAHVMRSEPSTLHIDVRPQPPRYSHQVEARRIVLRLAITGRNLRARQYDVGATFAGPWRDDAELADLRVDALTRLPRRAT